MKAYSYKITILLLISLFLSSCGGNKTVFEPGDLKEDFCGTYINYQYCECAFGEQFCEQVAMSPSEAEKYVNKEYEAWIERERLVFKNLCIQGGAIYKKDTCRQCPEGETVIDGKCQEQRTIVEEEKNLPPGACKDDNDCRSECEGDVMWNMTCNQETSSCVRSYDINCRENMETFGELSFSMICEKNECSRDEEAIKKMREQLGKELTELDEVDKRADRLDDLNSNLNRLCEESTVISEEEFPQFISDLDLFLSEDDIAKMGLDEEQADYLRRLLGGDLSENDQSEEEFLIDLSCSLKSYIAENKSVDLGTEELEARRDDLQSKLDRLPVIY